jgi:hypothetical protein
MSTYAGYTQMGSKPTAGRARLSACVAQSAPASNLRPWQLGSTDSTTPMFTDVADIHRHRRPPGRT